MTWAEMKRQLVPGTLLATHYHSDPFGKGDPPVRAILSGGSVKRLEACAWSRGNVSHFDLPPASQVTVHDDRSFTVHDPSGDPKYDRDYRIVEARDAVA
jgi:hypothetical protein